MLMLVGCFGASVAALAEIWSLAAVSCDRFQAMYHSSESGKKSPGQNTNSCRDREEDFFNGNGFHMECYTGLQAKANRKCEYIFWIHMNSKYGGLIENCFESCSSRSFCSCKEQNQNLHRHLQEDLSTCKSLV